MGLVGDAEPAEIVAYFSARGIDAVLFDAAKVCGPDHIVSARLHAERAFEGGWNRSRTPAMETILYAAGERQIQVAKPLMDPVRGKPMGAVLSGDGDYDLSDIGMERDDSVIASSDGKLAALGIGNPLGLDPADLALEAVAMLELEKK